ncbi:cyclin-dependent protein kinase inhibitor SMR3 [Eucalyptus grandis]|uniref:cyclin-dependent protein kinase inhibitor SMR3 n=1 Tax=Eucalyptus grandis TaxID=71139 RepID=UPI00192EC70C|nr:cyclin-dependent protein kinase inhibitor SMR3 [Eucalyptus grandis]
MSTDLQVLSHQTLSLASIHTQTRDEQFSDPIGRPNQVNDCPSGDDESCRTPRSEKHRIPAVLCCPPAPKKPRFSHSSCKRKLSELDFFDVVNHRKVDAFFELAAAAATAATATATAARISKRRRPL